MDLDFSLNFSYPKNRIDLEIKKELEHFIVEEISKFGLIPLNPDCSIFKEEQGDFLWFVLIKKNWNTDKALKAVAKYLRVSFRRFNWAGTKDKRALTSQLCSGFKIKKEELEKVRIKDLEIKCPFYKKEKIKLGDLKGNRFTIDFSSSHYSHFLSNSKGEFLNYFGKQRFGIRRNTHIIGYYIIKQKFEEAAYLFLTDTSYETNPKAVEARNKLKEHLDFKKAFQEFPKHLYLERMMLNHLKDHPRDFVNAFRKLPRPSLLTFVHAFQSFLFNKELSIRFKEQGWDIKKERNEYYCSKDSFGFPDLEKEGENFLVGNVIGYQSDLNPYEEQLLESYNLKKEEFEIKSFPELSAKGAKRVLLAPIVNPKFNNNRFSFSLSLGCYATTMLENFFLVKEVY